METKLNRRQHWSASQSRSSRGISRCGRDTGQCTGLFISPSGISELDCTTTKTDTAERSISIGRESLQVFFVLGALAYFQVPPLGGSRDEKWRSSVLCLGICQNRVSCYCALEVLDHVPHRTTYRQNNL